MVWSYSEDPSKSDRDAVRFEIGDTDSEDELLQDEEIEYTLLVESSIYGAAARCCEVLARKFARQADVALGPERVAASQRSEAYAKLGRELRVRTTSSNAPYAGGLSYSEQYNDSVNPDLKQPVFRRDIMSNCEGG